MKVFEINGNVREAGKTKSRKVRNAGLVPCVVYGNGDPVHFSLDKIAIRKALIHPDVFLFKLTVEGKLHNAIIREAQFHPVFEEPIHIDFLSVNESAPVEIDLPVKLVGTAAGLTVGGRLQQQARRLRVKGILNKLPERIEVNVTSLELGKTIRVNEVSFENFVVISPPNTPIAMVDVPRAAKTATPEAAATPAK